MITPVALNQSSFLLPGATIDDRKILVAPTILVSVPSFDRIVRLLAALSREVTLENGWARSRIILAKASGGQRQFLLQRPIDSSLDADFIATAAAAVGGLVHVGADRHYARYRDRHAPLGYDIATLHAGDEPFVLYNLAAVVTLTIEREHKIAELVKSLPLQSGATTSPHTIYFRGATGLLSRVAEYLLRRRCQVEIAHLSAQPELRESFVDINQIESLVRATAVPAPLVHDLARLPGITVFTNALDELDTSVSANLCLIERGFEHPLHLWGVRRALPKHETLLRGGHPQTCEVLPSPLYFIAGERLLANASTAPAISRMLVQTAVEAAPRLTLRPASTPRVPRGSFVSKDQLPKLVQLLYLLPEAHLRRVKGLALGDDLFILASAEHELPPLGTFYFAQARDILVPVGLELRPRLPADLLHAALRVPDGHFVVYLHGQEPLALPHAQLQPLSLQLIAQTHPQLITLSPRGDDAPAHELVNDSLGAFSLWGPPGVVR